MTPTVRSIARRKSLLWIAAGRALDRGDDDLWCRLADAVRTANRRIRRLSGRGRR